MNAEDLVKLARQSGDHVHHWLLDEPNGPESIGMCKVCGTHRVFKNWLPESDFLTNEEHRTAA